MIQGTWYECVACNEFVCGACVCICAACRADGENRCDMCCPTYQM